MNMIYDEALLKRQNGIHIEHISTGEGDEAFVCSAPLLVYTAHGSGFFRTPQKTEEICEGDAVLIAPKTTFSFYNSDTIKDMSVYSCPFLKSALTFSPKHIDIPLAAEFFGGGVPYILVHDTKRRTLRTIMANMLDNFVYSYPGYAQALENLLSLLIIEFFRLCSSNPQQSAPSSNVIAGIAMQYIKKHIHSKISLAELAEAVHISPQHLCRVFKECTSVTISEFANTLRVESIKYELENTERPIKIIYDDYDFSQQYIIRMFKAHTGMTPAEYKNAFNYKINGVVYE